MPMDSMQIAQMNGAFQQQNMQQLQAAGMIGGGMGPSMGEAFAGRMANVAGAVAAPAAMLGLGMMGRDPITAGLRGAWGMRGMGMMGMGAGGLAGAGAVAAPLMAGQWALETGMRGIQQQQQLNQALRDSFSFRNQFGGLGFTQAGMGQIGQTMRAMTTEVGPGGEMVGFEELGRLAANMGRMGMAQGVRDAKDFGDKFRQMVSTLKEIATDMGTSLEEAQKMMAGMRGAGVFDQAQAAGFARRIRIGGIAGGLATQEMTGMMNIGAQVSRMIGGRGRAGAQAGLQTIANIGTAVESGLMTEEQIYEATGLTGAEGRRALATQQLQGAARFLRGGRGRRIVAAMAGAGGELDPSAVAEFMAGGVGTGRTMQMAQEGVRRAGGRAAFIRNLGRLRGEVLEQFGGTLQAQIYRGWMQQRGIDVNVDQDRAMLFLQRQERMGRDEADRMVQMIQDLPQIQREQQVTEVQENFARRIERRGRRTGIEGVQREIAEASAGATESIQNAFVSLYEDTANAVDRMVNELTGTYVSVQRRDVTRAIDVIERGGATGRAMGARRLGMGPGGLGERLPGLRGDVLGMGRPQRAFEFMEEFERFDAERWTEAGYDILRGEGGRTTLAQRADPERTRDLIMRGMRSARTIEGIMGGRGADVGEFGTTAMSRLKAAFGARGLVSGRGAERLASAENAVWQLAKETGDPSLQDLADRLMMGGTREKANILAGLNRQMGIADQEAQMYRVPDALGEFDPTKFATQKDLSREIGQRLLGTRPETRARIEGMGFLTKTKDWINRNVAGMDFYDVGATEGAREAAAQWFQSEEGLRITEQALSGDAESRRRAADTLNDEIARLEREAERTPERAEVLRAGVAGRRSVLAAQKYMEIGGDTAPRERLAEAAREVGMSVEEFLQRGRGTAEAALGYQAQARRQFAREVGERARERRTGLLRAEVIGPGGELTREMTLTARGIGGGEEGVSTAAEEFMKSAAAHQASLEQFQEGMSEDAWKQVSEQTYGKGGTLEQRQAQMAMMSVSEKRRLAERLQERGAGAMAEELFGAAAGQQRLARGGQRRGMANIAEALGADIGAGRLREIMQEGGPEAVARAIGARIGVTGAGVADIQEAVSAAKAGEFGIAEQRVGAVLGGPEVEEQRKKRLEAKDPIKTEQRDLLRTLNTEAKNQSRILGQVNNHLSDIKLGAKSEED